MRRRYLSSDDWKNAIRASAEKFREEQKKAAAEAQPLPSSAPVPVPTSAGEPGYGDSAGMPSRWEKNSNDYDLLSHDYDFDDSRDNHRGGYESEDSDGDSLRLRHDHGPPGYRRTAERKARKMQRQRKRDGERAARDAWRNRRSRY